MLFWNKMIIYLFYFLFYRCLLVIRHSINTMFYFDPLVMTKFFKIKMKLIPHLNIASWLYINSNFVYPIVHVENTNSVAIYLKIMSGIEIWIHDIYELDNFIKTWKSSNTYNLPNREFLKFFLTYFIIWFANIKT
jgi:hypothetical protein